MPVVTSRARATGGRAAPSALLAATLVVTALNLRPAITSVGALLRDIQLDLGMSDTVAGVLTSLPVLCFGIVGLVAGRIGRRVGTERALVLSMALVLAGLVLRATAPSATALLGTSLIALAGMAVANVLMPVVVKAWFPSAVGWATGLYSTGIMVGTMLGGVTSVPLANALGGWRWGLGSVAALAAAALASWAALGVARRERPADAVPAPGTDGVRGAGEVAAPLTVDLPSAPAVFAMWRSPRAWALVVFFGLQSLEAQFVMGWWPAILQDAGVSPATAGVLMGTSMLFGVPVALVVAPLVARWPDQRAGLVATTIASVLALVGVLVAPRFSPVLWTVLMGIGLSAFPLALLLIGMRTSSARATSDLSALTHGAGYLIAATGPFTIGALHDATGGWSAPLIVMIALTVPRLVSGWVIGKPGPVDVPSSRAASRPARRA